MTPPNEMSAHAKEPTWRCTSCGTLLSDSFVNPHPAGESTVYCCKLCGGACESLSPPPQSQTAEQQGAESEPSPRLFFAELPAAFSYPFRGQGVVLLIVGALFFAFIDFARNIPIANLGALFWGAYLMAFMFKIIATTATGENELPDWPNFKDFSADIGYPLSLSAAATLVSYLPLALYAAVGWWYDYSFFSWIAAGILLFLGVCYQPMALLSVAIHYSYAGLDPRKVFPAIRRVLVPYSAACIVLALIFGFRAFQQAAVSFLPIPVVGSVLNSIVAFYLTIVEMRILGLLYRCYQDRFKWLDDI